MTARHRILILALGTALLVPSHDVRAAAGPWTIEDVVTEESAGAWDIGADGRRAVWLRSAVEEVDGEDTQVSQLWMTDLATGASVQLTREPAGASRPAVAPDGRHVAFLSERAVPGAEDLGEVQVWAMPLAGGEAFPVTRFDRSVRDLAWVDADTLVVLAQESPSAWELARKEADDTTVVVDDAEHEPPVRLFRVQLEGGEVTRLTTNDEWVDSLAVAPGGRHAVVTAQRSLSYEFDQRVPPATWLVDLATGTTTPLLGGTDLLPQSVRWAPDGGSFYFVNEFSRHPRYRTATVSQLWRYDLASGSAAQVPLGEARGLARDHAPTGDGVVALLHGGVRFQPVRLERSGDGWRRRTLSGSHVANIDAWELARDGRTLVYRHSTATTPPQWYAARLEGAAIVGERRITDLNPSFAGKPTGRVEVVRWEGAEGDEVEGLLHYPLDWREGERRPLLLSIHGGPTGVDRDAWSQSWAAPLLLWRQRGAFVLEVNYHGSTGYGLDWVESIGEGRYYDLEVPDLVAGVDAMIARGLADPERLGTTGWSNGGILSAALITASERWRAASIGAADVEWFSDWANVDFGAAFDNYYFGGPPWDVPEVYLEKSPFFRLEKVTTPTIVFTGTADTNVPPHQSWSLFRALQQIGRAPARLVLFPDEPHGLRKIAHQRRKLSEELAWFDRHLFGTGTAANPAVKEGSPLAALLARRRAAVHGGRLGVEAAGVLVPETVTHEGLEVGRFEVTRAQWAAFDPSLGIAPGEADLPVTAVAFERAREYAAWLAQHTGRPFRLPTAAEARRLAKEGGGNTLDRWAGYAPNPDDRERLAEALAPLAGAPLLLPVGSLPGAGAPMVFDLDGNVAEWAVGPDGGVAVGPSADRPADPRSRLEPSPAYTGLRVVVGGPAER